MKINLFNFDFGDGKEVCLFFIEFGLLWIRVGLVEIKKQP